MNPPKLAVVVTALVAVVERGGREKGVAGERRGWQYSKEA